MRWSITDDIDERYFDNYDMVMLRMDEFYLNVDVPQEGHYYLYTLNKECFECPYLRYNGENLTRKIFQTNLKFKIGTDHREYLPQEVEENVVCSIDENFGQFGVYNVNINDRTCKVSTLKEPKNIYSPIITVILIYIALYLVVYCLRYGWKRFKKRAKNEQTDQPKSGRIRSLDTFRGVAIVIMIFANYGCGGYEILEHAKWNGLHLADLVFPWFMWIMGACIPIALWSNFKKNVTNGFLIQKIFQRTVKLFVIGIVLGSGTDLKYLRIFGVLQRFAVAYLCCSLICVFCMNRSKEVSMGKLKAYFEDIFRIYTGWIVVIIILIIHTTINLTVSASGCPKGYLGPGGLHKNQSYVKCTGGATGYIDKLILGSHVYQRPTFAKVYETGAFDPEGIVGSLTTIFHVFIGVQAGVILIVYKKHTERLGRFLVWAVALGLIGGFLCGFSKESGLIPVNKNLWSLSFVLLTSSFAYFLLSFIYLLTDVKNWWSGKPFLYAGMNALLMYIGHEITGQMFPVRWYPHNDILAEPRRSHFISLLSDLWGVGIWITISYYWYKIGYFFNI